MESRRSILNDTFEELRTVEAAIDSLTDFLNGSPSGASALDNCKFAVDLLQSRSSKCMRMLDQSLSFIEDYWKDIIQSEPLENEVYRFCNYCTDLYGKVWSLDDSICWHDELVVEVLEDCWLVRRLLVAMTHWINRAKFVIDFANENFCDRRSELGAFLGMARRFRSFFVGVSDEELRDLVIQGKPLSSRPIWRGERCEGTLMGKELGLSCADMNHSFVFLSDKKMPRPLKYSSDQVSNDRKFYKISAPLDLLKRARELTRISQESANRQDYYYSH